MSKGISKRNFGQLIRKLRKEYDPRMTIQELADKVGRNSSYISLFERGKVCCPPTDDLLKNIANTFHMAAHICADNVFLMHLHAFVFTDVASRIDKNLWPQLIDPIKSLIVFKDAHLTQEEIDLCTGFIKEGPIQAKTALVLYDMLTDEEWKELEQQAEKILAPRDGLEPPTDRLTADCSTN